MTKLRSLTLNLNARVASICSHTIATTLKASKGLRGQGSTESLRSLRGEVILIWKMTELIINSLKILI
jgi:hypothetical protein